MVKKTIIGALLALAISAPAFALPAPEVFKACDAGVESDAVTLVLIQEWAGRQYITKNLKILVQFDASGMAFILKNMVNGKAIVDMIKSTDQACAFMYDIVAGNLIQSSTKEK